MRAREFIDKFKSWKGQRETAPVPPPHNLFHATFKDNLPSIMTHGLLKTGVEKLYKESEAGVVYLTTSAEIASSMLNKQSSMINKDLLKKMSSDEGVILEIDVSKLDPELFRQDEMVPAHWLNPKYTYKYEGNVPPDAIKIRTTFSLELQPYYRRHEMRAMKPLG